MHTEAVPAAIGIIFCAAIFALGFAAGDWHGSRKRDTAKPLSESAEAAARALGVAPERKHIVSERERAWDARHGQVRRG